MKQKIKGDLFAIGYVAFIVLLATGFAWWHKSIQGDVVLFAGIFCINGLGLMLYTLCTTESKDPLWIFPIDALVLFLLLQISLSAVYWGPAVLTVLNALLVRLFGKDWIKFSATDSVIANIVGFGMGYAFFFFVKLFTGF